MWKIGQRVWHAIRHPLGGDSAPAPNATPAATQPAAPPAGDSSHVSEAARAAAPAPAEPAPAPKNTPAPAAPGPSRPRTADSRPTIGILVEEPFGEKKWVNSSNSSLLGNSGYFTTCNAPGAIKLYAQAVEEAGGNVRWIYPDGRGAHDQIQGLHALLVPGGRDIHPEYYGAKEDRAAGLNLGNKNFDAFEIDVIKMALSTPMPLRGICRGQQLLNIAEGGTLMQDIGNNLGVSYPYAMAHRDNTHPVHIVPSARLAAIMEKDHITVNSHHHQAIDAVAPGYFVTARAADSIIEGIQKADRPNVLGVQFHPEKPRNESQVREHFFASLMQDARNYWDEFDPLPADAKEEKTQRTHAGDNSSSSYSGSSSAPVASKPANTSPAPAASAPAAAPPPKPAPGPPDFSQFSQDAYVCKLHEGLYHMEKAGHVLMNSYGERFSLGNLNKVLSQTEGKWSIKQDPNDLTSEMKVDRGNLEDFLLSWMPDGPDHMKNQELAQCVRDLRFMAGEKSLHLYKRGFMHNAQLNIMQSAWRLQNKEDVRLSPDRDDRDPLYKVHNFEELRGLVASLQPKDDGNEQAPEQASEPAAQPSPTGATPPTES